MFIGKKEQRKRESKGGKGESRRHTKKVGCKGMKRKKWKQNENQGKGIKRKEENRGKVKWGKVKYMAVFLHKLLS